MTLDAKAVLDQIDAVLAACKAMAQHAETAASAPMGRAGVSALDATRTATSLIACIDRMAPPGSSYRESVRTVREGYQLPTYPVYRQISALFGILTALREDYAADRIKSVIALVHADMFGDFLEMATHLLGEGFKDAAAVIVGSTLEGHLRKLCEAATPKVDTTRPDGSAKKAEMLNQDLVKAGVYNTTDQKSVTAWLGRRNEAAHGHHGMYDAQQVSLMLDGVRDFIRRLPA